MRVFQQFATLDLLSGGRAEIMAGRGSFIESFPLFGYDLDDYDELFAEKLDLLLQLRESERSPGPASIARRSTISASIRGPLQDRCRSGSPSAATPQSVVRAGALGLPMALAIIGGMPERFAPLARALPPAPPRRRGHEPPAAQHQLARLHRRHVAGRRPTSRFPPFAGDDDRIGRERGWPPMTREQFERSRTLRGANFVGSPQEVVEKILFQHEIFGHERFLLQLSVGSLPHAKMMRAIELFGTEVAPVVRAEIARSGPLPVPAG